MKLTSIIISLLIFCSLVSAQKLEPFSNDGKFGFKKGNKVPVPAKYDYALHFSSGLAAVKQNGKWGFIDTTGALKIPIKFQNVSAFSDGYAKFMENNLLGLIDSTGKIVLEPCADFISIKDYWNGLDEFELRLKGKVGAFNRETQILVLPAYEAAWCGDYHCIVKIGKQNYGMVINEELKVDGLTSRPYFSGKEQTKAYTKKGVGILNKKGEWLIDPVYNGVSLLTVEGEKIYLMSHGNSFYSADIKDYEMYDYQGNKISEMRFSAYKEYTKYAPIIEEWGEEPYYEKLPRFISSKGQKFKLVKKNGKLSLELDRTIPFESNGYSISSFYKNGKHGLVLGQDTLLDAVYDTITQFKSDAGYDNYEYNEWGEPVYSEEKLAFPEFLKLVKEEKSAVYSLSEKKVLGDFNSGTFDANGDFLRFVGKDFELLYLNDKVIKGRKIDSRWVPFSEYMNCQNPYLPNFSVNFSYLVIEDGSKYKLVSLSGDEIYSGDTPARFHSEAVMLVKSDNFSEMETYNLRLMNDLKKDVVKDVFILDVLDILSDDILFDAYGEYHRVAYEPELFYINKENKIGALLSNGYHIPAIYDSIRGERDLVKMYLDGKMDLLVFTENEASQFGGISYYRLRCSPNTDYGFEEDEYNAVWAYVEDGDKNIYATPDGARMHTFQSQLAPLKTNLGIGLIEKNNKSGGMTTPFLPYQKVKPHWGGNYHLAKGKIGKAWGISLLGGKEIIPPKFKKFRLINDNTENHLIIAQGESGDALYNLKGEQIFEGEINTVSFPSYDFPYLMEIKSKNGITLVDYRNGALLSPKNISGYEILDATGFNDYGADEFLEPELFILMNDSDGKNYIYISGYFNGLFSSPHLIKSIDKQNGYFQTNVDGVSIIYAINTYNINEIMRDDETKIVALEGHYIIMKLRDKNLFKVYDISYGMQLEGMFEHYRIGAEGLEIKVGEEWKMASEMEYKLE